MRIQEISPTSQGNLAECFWMNHSQYAEAGRMIDEINYFPERENYQKKKKVGDGWKELKKKKIVQDSKKPENPDSPPKSKSPQKEK